MENNILDDLLVTVSKREIRTNRQIDLTIALLQLLRDLYRVNKPDFITIHEMKLIKFSKYIIEEVMGLMKRKGPEDS